MATSDDKVCLWVADANGTPMPLVQLGDVPTDGTWEVLHGGDGWVPFVEATHFAPQFMVRMLVVARPIGSGD